MKKSTVILSTLIATVGLSVPATVYVVGQNNLAETQAKQEFATSTSVSSETQQSYAYSSQAKEQQEQQVKTEAAIEAKYENDNADQQLVQFERTMITNGYTCSTVKAGKTIGECYNDWYYNQGYKHISIYIPTKYSMTRTVDNSDVNTIVSSVYYNQEAETLVVVPK